MISLIDACKTVLQNHPSEYIHVVNEYKDAFQFVLLNNGEEPNELTCVVDTPAVIKNTGRLIDDATCIDDVFNGEYTQYTADQIESLLDNSRKAS